MQGWECPKCGKCHSPLILHCDCHEFKPDNRPTSTRVIRMSLVEIKEKYLPNISELELQSSQTTATAEAQKVDWQWRRTRLKID